jgi:hypothetical protein
MVYAGVPGGGEDMSHVNSRGTIFYRKSTTRSEGLDRCDDLRAAVE